MLLLDAAVTAVIHDKTYMLKLCNSLLNTTEQSELSADWDDLQTLKWAQTVDPHQSEECELLLETYSMQVCLSFLLWTCSIRNTRVKATAKYVPHKGCKRNWTVCQRQAETLSSAEQGYWCRHLWHSITHCIPMLSWLSMSACCKGLEAQTWSTAML